MAPLLHPEPRSAESILAEMYALHYEGTYGEMACADLAASIIDEQYEITNPGTLKILLEYKLITMRDNAGRVQPEIRSILLQDKKASGLLRKICRSEWIYITAGGFTSDR